MVGSEHHLVGILASTLTEKSTQPPSALASWEKDGMMGRTILIFNIALWVLRGLVETRELKDFRAETEGQQPERAYTWHGTRLTASVRLTTDIPESRPCTERGISG